MEVKIIDLPIMYFVGLKAQLTMKETDEVCPALWDELWKTKGDFGNDPEIMCLGVCTCEEDCSGTKKYTYMAGFASPKPLAKPEGLSSHEISACKYARFTHKGPVSTLKQTFEYAFKEWIPKSEYKHKFHEDLELYDEKFKPNNPEESEMYIFIPVE